jgi:hypothetical protein
LTTSPSGGWGRAIDSEGLMTIDHPLFYALVADPSGAIVPGARVQLKNAVTGYAEATITDTSGS